MPVSPLVADTAPPATTRLWRGVVPDRTRVLIPRRARARRRGMGSLEGAGKRCQATQSAASTSQHKGERLARCRARRIRRSNWLHRALEKSPKAREPRGTRAGRNGPDCRSDPHFYASNADPRTLPRLAGAHPRRRAHSATCTPITGHLEPRTGAMDGGRGSALLPRGGPSRAPRHPIHR